MRRIGLVIVAAFALSVSATAQAASLHVVFPQAVETTVVAGQTSTPVLEVQAFGATRCDATTADVRIDSLYSVDAVGDIAPGQPQNMAIQTAATRGSSDNCYIQTPVEVPLTVTTAADTPPGDYTGVVKYGFGGDGDVSEDGPQLIVHVLAPDAAPEALPTPALEPPPELVVLGEREAPKPVLGKSVMLTLVKGRVVYRQPGKAGVVLKSSVVVPNGTRVDASGGVVKVSVVRNQTGGLDSVDAWSGGFKVVQTVGAGRGLTTLTLSGAVPAASKLASAARKHKKGARRSLWVNGKGNFKTRGKRASAIVMGTFWHTQETASGTRVTVKRGVVGVRDFVRHRLVVVTKGHSYLAAPRIHQARRIPAFTGSV